MDNATLSISVAEVYGWANHPVGTTTDVRFHGKITVDHQNFGADCVTDFVNPNGRSIMGFLKYQNVVDPQDSRQELSGKNAQRGSSHFGQRFKQQDRLYALSTQIVMDIVALEP
jgi:hypothetical protein